VLRSELLRRLAQVIPGTRLQFLTLHSFSLINEYRHLCHVPGSRSAGTVVLGATPTTRERTLSALLDPFNEQACNAHLFMLIFDLALLALFPEMAVGASGSGVGSP